MSIPETKFCTACGVEKAAEAFGKRRAKWRNRVYECLTAYCKKCLCAKASTRWHETHGPRKFSKGETSAVKICKRCRAEKTIQEFSMIRSRRRADGTSASYAYPYCRECARTRAIENFWRNRERYRLKRAENYERNREARCEYARRYRAGNKDLVAAQSAAYKKANRAAATAAQNARYSLNRRATPRFLSWLHKLQIVESYEIAAAKSIQTGIKHHVDHVFPLRGKGFCGLNVPWNLEAIPASDNVRKWRNVAPRFAQMLWEEVT